MQSTSRFDKLIKPFIILLVISSLFLTYSCETEDSLGFDVLPPSDSIIVSGDTVRNIIAYSVEQDSLSTENVTTALLGYINDPVFGKAKAGFVTQLRLSSDYMLLKDDAQADSLVLTLRYKTDTADVPIRYGSMKYDMRKLFVYELTESLPTNAVNETFNVEGKYNPAEIGQKTYKPFRDTLIHIQISDVIMNRIVDAARDTLSSNTILLNDILSGVYITCEETHGAIEYFDLYSSDTHLTLYYSDSETSASTEQDFKYYDFNVSYYSRKINILETDYTGTVIESHLNDPQHENDTVFYLQGMGGLKAHIQLPDIQNQIVLPEKACINQAILVFPVEISEDDADIYPPPEGIRLYEKNDEGDIEYLREYYYVTQQGTEYLAEQFDEDNKEYRFNITRYVQDLVDGTKENYGLELQVKNSKTTANRAIMKNGNDRSIELHITYTNLE